MGNGYLVSYTNLTTRPRVRCPTTEHAARSGGSPGDGVEPLMRIVTVDPGDVPRGRLFVVVRRRRIGTFFDPRFEIIGVGVKVDLAPTDLVFRDLGRSV